MSSSLIRAFRHSAVAGVAAIAIIPGLALAQAETEQSDEPQAADIVVTGTLIRGTAPVGSSAITLGQQRLEQTAAISSNELLASIPQVTNYFNNVPLADLAIAPNQIQISRPNLRNISPNNASSSATLILMDGHRIASAGVNQASIDPDVIPTGAIERVEVLTEGGSATYGADAVAGVINFITRRRFDGLKVDGHYGFADDYYQWDASVTAGKDWGSGSAYISYTYTKNDALFGHDRNFIRNLNYSAQPYVGMDLTCGNPNLLVNTVIPAAGVTVASVPYAAPNFLPGTSNTCDNGEDSTYIPRAERHGVLAGLSQDLDDRTTVDIRAFYSRRKTVSIGVGDLGGTVAVSPDNPYVAASLPAGLTLGPTTIMLDGVPFPIPAVNQAAVSFNLSPLVGVDAQHAGTLVEEWGFNAEFKHDLTDDWQVRALFNWSESDSSYRVPRLNPTRLAIAGTTTALAGAFNPFDVRDNDPALIADLMDNEIAGQAKDSLLDLRVLVEGKLFDLPGGDVRLAFGYEYMNDRLAQRFQSDIRLGTLGSFPFTNYGRDVHSVFGELRLPLIADDHGGSMLTVSGSGRYDHYSDFGNTFNPKIGATFKPADWISVRGNWGTSFTAPTPLDQLGSLRNTISSFPFVPFTKPGETAPGGAFAVALQGSTPDLRPQKADTWSVGMDLTPISGLRASVSYYDVKFKGILSTPLVDGNIVTNFPDQVRTNVNGFSAADLLAFGAQAPGGTAVVQSLIDSGALVYELVDFRVANFGILHVKGLDFQLNYQFQTDFGSFDLAVNGNRPLSRKAKPSPNSPVLDQLDTENPKLFLQATLGANVGPLRAEATWNHTGGFDIVPTPSVPVQDHVGAFNTVDLFFKYDIPGESAILRDLSLTLNVKNVLDEDPPLLLRTGFGSGKGFANGFTFGRMFILGLSKKF